MCKHSEILYALYSIQCIKIKNIEIKVIKFIRSFLKIGSADLLKH